MIYPDLQRKLFVNTFNTMNGGFHIYTENSFSPTFAHGDQVNSLQAFTENRMNAKTYFVNTSSPTRVER